MSSFASFLMTNWQNRLANWVKFRVLGLLTVHYKAGGCNFTA